MVTKIKSNNSLTCNVEEYFGLSTDIKPIEGVLNASIFYEMDTMNVWLFDRQNQLWLLQKDAIKNF